MSAEISFDKYFERLTQANVTLDIGKVLQVTGFLIKGVIPGVCLGSICEIYSLYGNKKFQAEVVGFDNQFVLLMPIETMTSIGLGSKIILKRLRSAVPVGDELLGRVIDGRGNPIDNLGDLNCSEERDIQNEVVNPLDREAITEPLCMGIRAIDGLLTVGRGQKVGILAGSGVGKSVLLGNIAEGSDADINVIALIGERGREVKEFIENSLGEEGLKKSVIIAVTSDDSPLLRVRGAMLSLSISEYFAAQGKNVLLMMDSVTRFAMAQREIGLNIGEPPTAKGYTPSVFSLLPKLLERVGNFQDSGSITGLFTVLVEGDDLDDPISDSVRSIVDGHIVLSRALAEKAHYPAIDVLKSNSRVMGNVITERDLLISQKVRESIAQYRDVEDLINIGAYKEGINAKIDESIASHEGINQFLRQNALEKNSFEDIFSHLGQLVGI